MASPDEPPSKDAPPAIAAAGRPWTRIHGATVLGRRTDQTGDLYICGDRIAAAPPPGTPIQTTIDGHGHHAMAGGIDLHTHIGGGKLTIARLMMQSQMQPSDFLQQHPCLPTPALAAQRYLDIGYTTCFEPAIVACNARSAHLEMAGCIGLDTGGYCLLGNEPALLAMIADQTDRRIIAAYVAAMVAATGCIGVKVVNPGGIDAFKYNVRQLDVDQQHPRYHVTPAEVIRVLTRAIHDIGLRHPLHVHCSNLGVPGNIESTLATINAAEGLPIHITHVQFHSYGKSKSGMTTAASRIADAMRRHPNVTMDVGQIVFGRTATISADTMHQFSAAKRGNPQHAFIADLSSGGGCGVVPFRYRHQNFVNALQWSIGLELLLMIDDPSRIFLTTDHPNGGPFTAYPHLIRLLADRTYRDEILQTIHPDAIAATELSGLQRQYTIQDIHAMTRTGPADVLGLHDRGGLSVGDVADVVLIADHGDWQTRFQCPRLVIRRGKLIRDNGTIVDADLESTPHHIVAADRNRLANLASDLDHQRIILDYQKQYGDSTFAQTWIDDDEFPNLFKANLSIAGDVR